MILINDRNVNNLDGIFEVISFIFSISSPFQKVMFEWSAVKMNENNIQKVIKLKLRYEPSIIIIIILDEERVEKFLNELVST